MNFYIIKQSATDIINGIETKQTVDLRIKIINYLDRYSFDKKVEDICENILSNKYLAAMFTLKLYKIEI